MRALRITVHYNRVISYLSYLSYLGLRQKDGQVLPSRSVSSPSQQWPMLHPRTQASHDDRSFPKGILTRNMYTVFEGDGISFGSDRIWHRLLPPSVSSSLLELLLFRIRSPRCRLIGFTCNYRSCLLTESAALKLTQDKDYLQISPRG